ncbi:hypothetical protein EF904_25765, partial [Streptomyces sp. WAC05950]
GGGPAGRGDPARRAGPAGAVRAAGGPGGAGVARRCFGSSGMHRDSSVPPCGDRCRRSMSRRPSSGQAVGAGSRDRADRLDSQIAGLFPPGQDLFTDRSVS